jgi:uncharacterized protein YkwD
MPCLVGYMNAIFRQTALALVACACVMGAALSACGDGDGNDQEGQMGEGGGSPGGSGDGGTIGTGGTPRTGGVPGTGGTPRTGGVPGTGGTPRTGGAPGTGGTVSMPPTGSPGEPGQCSLMRAGATGSEAGGQIPVCCTPAGADKALIDEVFNLLNAHRAANGRSALAYDAKLELAMQGHCQHMAQHTFFAHEAPESAVGSPTARASLCGANASGENIAFNQQSPAQVMTSWKNSAGHNTNMLNASYRRVGIGEFKLRWGQIFGR